MSERNDYIKAISKVSRALSTTIERDKLLEMIVKSAVDTMKAKAACLFLATDETKEEYVAVAQTGLSKSYVHAAPGRMAPTMKLLKKDGFIHYRDAAEGRARPEQGGQGQGGDRLDPRRPRHREG